VENEIAGCCRPEYQGSLKTLVMTKLTPEKIELATLSRENGTTQIKIFPADQLDELIKKYKKVEAELKAVKKEKSQTQKA